jgi:DNA repair exonuclease SbcCD nuclease subunit
MQWVLCLKVAILGDFHFGYDRFYDDSFMQAEQALLKAQEQADLLIVAGDIFDSRTPKQEVIARSFEAFKQLHKKVIVIHGTHERRPHGFTNPVDLLVKAGFAESCHARPILFEKDGEKVAVYGLAGVPEDYAKVALERLGPKPVEGAFNIFMFHQNLKELMPLVESGLTMDDLPAGFDLYVDGHLHKNYELEKGGRKLLIPGSTVLTQVRREEKEKGFYLYDTKEKSQTYVTIVTRPFIHLTLLSQGTTPLKETLTAKLSQLDFTGKPIIRIDVEGDAKAIDQSEITSLKQAYADKCHLFINLSLDEGEEIYLGDLEELAKRNVSIRERGMLILKEVAARRNLQLDNLEEAFEMMCDAEDRELSEYFIRITSGKHE